MKINLKYQLCGLVSLTALFAVGLLGIITWYYSNNLVSDLRSARLRVIASLKSKELTQTLLLFSTTATSLAGRSAIINALAIPEDHDSFYANWTTATRAFTVLLSTYTDVLYVSVQSKTLERCYLNVTTIEGYSLLDRHVYDETQRIRDAAGDTAGWNASHGSPEQFWELIPTQDRRGVEPRDVNDGIFLGPSTFNRSSTGEPVYAASFTVPVYNNTTALLSRKILGYITVVFNIHPLLYVTNNTQGLGNTGQVLLLGPHNRLNRWDNQSREFKINPAIDMYQYILPTAKHPEIMMQTYLINKYPLVLKAWQEAKGKGGHNGVDLDVQNVFGMRASVGYSTVEFDATNSSFLLIVEQLHSETFEPMFKLRKIMLSTVFGTVAFIFIVTFPAAHYTVGPIRRLHEATKLCGRPPAYCKEPKKRPWWSPMRMWSRSCILSDSESISGVSSQNSSGRRDNFRIPQKVMLGKHLFTDELTSLIGTFNAMTDELLDQYESLEVKVEERTEQLKQQTVLAESANEAKTMFIANVSHELRTPLNGILGMCQLVLGEPGLEPHTRENLEVALKSGQLLLHLLTDLITFSKNQVWGAQVKMEMAPFRVSDFVTQIMVLFGGQAKEKNIELTCEVVPHDGLDYALVGDINRILQVAINLISNALKFTGENGSVQMMVVMKPLDSMDVTPYSDVSESQDYMSAPIFFRDSPGNMSPVGLPSPPIPTTHIHPPYHLDSISSPSLARPTRPPLFNRRSTVLGGNIESDITKTFMMRSKKLLNPETAAEIPVSRPRTPVMTAPAHWVEFRVIDTGPGVPEDMQQKIFEPFVQADVGLSRKYGGTGLGLSICQQLAKLMGGNIHVKSFEGAGSTFTLRIPMQFSMLDSPARESSTGCERADANCASKSLSAFSVATFSTGHSAGPSTPPHQDGGLRLVGLSQPFFVPRRSESEHGSDKIPLPLPPPHTGDGKGKEVETAVDEVTTRPGGNEDVEEERVAMEEEKVVVVEEKVAMEGDVEDDAGRAIRILVVEDNKINQRLVVKVLQLEGVQEVMVAEDGVEAVARVRGVMAAGETFDIIFMDIQMPNMDGHEAARQIRGLGYNKPIVALTAFAEDSNIRECYESGMDCFLSKPIKRPQIKQMVELYCPDKIE